VGTFEVWPTARPFVMMEKGERLTIPLRVSPGQLDARIANVSTEDAARKAAQGSAQPARPSAEQGSLEFPAGAVSYQIRPGVSRGGYWVDISVAIGDDAGRFTWSANVTDPATHETFPIELSALVLKDNLTISPRSLDVHDLSLATLKNTPVIAANLNVRKMIGSIHIKGISSSLALVKGGWQVLVDGSNYLVKVYVIANPGVEPGKYQGTINISTDDPAHAQIEVPLTITLIP